ncbi:hypothetical protein JCM11251_007950 [Rhodosporidiobolus azoricus]
MTKDYPAPKRQRRLWPWIVGAIVAIAVILGAVLGGVLGSRAANDDDNGGSSKSSAAVSNAANPAERTKAAGGLAIIPTATDQFGNPMYPTATGSARITAPTVLSNSSLSCGSDPVTGQSLSSPRTDHPMLIAPSYRWECLPKLIEADSYMKYWNETIFANATRYYDMSPTNYSIDGGLGGSGVLDPAREVQLRIKHWAYAYRMSNDTKWVDRTWREVQTAAGNSTDDQYFGVEGNNWNTQHFLDVAEFTAAFAYAYDWMYDAWTEEQRNAIMWSIINLGLRKGLEQQSNGGDWWARVYGNWNCVCTKGLALGALAIFHDDPTPDNVARTILNSMVESAATWCSYAPSPDGTWAETPNYWYFGTYSHVEFAAALLTATGSDQNLLTANPGLKNSGKFHMYVTGMQGLFSYYDAGPNKYTATANGIMFYGQQYDDPTLTLFQRDRGDAPEPMSMFYYDPQVSGQFWDGLALDHYFPNDTDSWFSARTSWTDNDGSYIAMRASRLTNHQTHGDLDAGTFLIDAMGQRWAGELGNGDYLANGYFSSEAQDSVRWLYYRKGTEGQNTLLLNDQNQNVDGVPVTNFGTTNDTQDALVYTAPNASTAFFTAELTSFYNDTTSANRAMRYLNGRKQILVRDELETTATIQWRMHTNATVSLSNNDRTATLELGGKTLIAELTGATDSEATFGTEDAVRDSSQPTQSAGTTMSPDQPNPGVTVLTVNVAAGTRTIEVLFNPQWDDMNESEYITPANVAIADWSVTSHDA